jgi:hypothetical protein
MNHLGPSRPFYHSKKRTGADEVHIAVIGLGYEDVFGVFPKSKSTLIQMHCRFQLSSTSRVGHVSYQPSTTVLYKRADRKPLPPHKSSSSEKQRGTTSRVAWQDVRQGETTCLRSGAYCTVGSSPAPAWPNRRRRRRRRLLDPSPPQTVATRFASHHVPISLPKGGNSRSMSNVVDPSQGHPPPIQSTGQRCRIKEIDDEYMVAMTKYYRRFMATYDLPGFLRIRLRCNIPTPRLNILYCYS